MTGRAGFEKPQDCVVVVSLRDTVGLHSNCIANRRVCLVTLSGHVPRHVWKNSG